MTAHCHICDRPRMSKGQRRRVAALEADNQMLREAMEACKRQCEDSTVTEQDSLDRIADIKSFSLKTERLFE